MSVRVIFLTREADRVTAMRILHVVWTLEAAAGGPPMVATRLAQAQARLGHSVTILTHAPRSGLPEALPAPSNGQVTVAIARVPATGLERLFGVEARQRLSTMLQSTDMVHIHGIWAPLGWLAGSAATNANVPYCVTPHGMLDPWALNGQGRFKKAKKHAAIVLFLRRHLNSAAFVHVLNADEQRLLEPLRLDAPTQIIPNGVPVEEFEHLPSAGTFAKACPQVLNRRYVLFLARLHAKKGLDILVGAFSNVAARHPDVDLVIAGPDDGALIPLRHQVAQLGLERRVHMVGPLYGGNKLAALAECACLALPSRQEGFSISILEAMACGRPVVISDACHFPEVAEASAGIVIPCSTSELVQALETVLRDESLATRMGDCGKRLVGERFTWHVAAMTSIGAYERAWRLHTAGPTPSSI